MPSLRPNPLRPLLRLQRRSNGSCRKARLEDWFSEGSIRTLGDCNDDYQKNEQ